MDNDLGTIDITGMTIEDAVAHAARLLDAMLVARHDALVLKMIACGVDEENMQDLLDQQREVDAAWRASSLEDIRLMLEQP